MLILIFMPCSLGGAGGASAAAGRNQPVRMASLTGGVLEGAAPPAPRVEPVLPGLYCRSNRRHRHVPLTPGSGLWRASLGSALEHRPA